MVQKYCSGNTPSPDIHFANIIYIYDLHFTSQCIYNNIFFVFSFNEVQSIDIFLVIFFILPKKTSTTPIRKNILSLLIFLAPTFRSMIHF